MSRVITRTLSLAATLALALTALPALAQTRTFENDLGVFEVPDNPSRIVTTHHANTQTLLDLGFIPVGRGDVNAAQATPEQWAMIADVPVISLEGGELNYELIASLEPDLIIEADLASSPERLDRLRQIAPVVVTPLRGQDFRLAKSTQFAEFLGATERYDELEAAYAARLEQIATDYADVLAAHPIGILGVWNFDRPSVWHSDSIVGRILAPAGAVFGAASEALPHDPGVEVSISHEEILATFADVDIIFFNSLADGSAVNGEHERVRALDIFQRLPAAQAGHVYPIGQITVGSYAVAHNTLDHFEAALQAISGAQ